MGAQVNYKFQVINLHMGCFYSEGVFGVLDNSGEFLSNEEEKFDNRSDMNKFIDVVSVPVYFTVLGITFIQYMSVSVNTSFNIYVLLFAIGSLITVFKGFKSHKSFKKD